MSDSYGDALGGESVRSRASLQPLRDGSSHPVDSSDAAFGIPGRLACLGASRRAKPILREPIKNVPVEAPRQYERRVPDRARGRGAASERGTIGIRTMALSSVAPLSQMFGYGADRAVRTHRQATFTMTFSHSAPAIRREDSGDRAADVAGLSGRR